MSTDVIMPKLGLTMEEGSVVAWLKAPGDAVEKGQPLLEVETDKVIVEVEAPATGVLGPLLVQEGEVVPLGTVLARIYEADERIESSAPEESARSPAEAKKGDGAGKVLAAAVKAVTAAPELRSTSRIAAGRRLFSSPRARKRARELGLDWRTVRGSGPDGRVVERDVLAAARMAVSAPAEAPTNRSIAQATVLSLPAFHLSALVRLAPLLDANTRIAPWLEQQFGLHLMLADWLVRIAASLLAKHPHLLQGGREHCVDIGVLSGIEADSDIAVIREAQHKTLIEIARARLHNETDKSGPLSLLVADLSEYRIDTVAIIPQTAPSLLLVLGHREEGRATLTLSGNGEGVRWQAGAAFLQHLVEKLEEPLQLWG